MRDVIILCQHFYPEEASTGQFATELAEDLSGYGYGVSVITAQPTYFLKSKDRLESCCLYKNIHIGRVLNTRFNRNNIAGRILNSLTYVFLTFLELFLRPASEIILVYTNPPFLPLAAFLSRILRNQRYIVIVYDVYPDAAFETGYFRFLKSARGIFDFVNKIIFNSSERVIVIGRCMKNLLLEKGVKPSKITFIPNWADGNFIKPLEKTNNPIFKECCLSGEFIVEYCGALSLYNDFDTVVLAAEKLKDLPILFLFVSSGVKTDALKEEVKKRGLKNFIFLPYQPKGQLRYTFTLGNVGLVIQKESFMGVNVPSKIYSYLAAGIPVIGIVPAGSEAARIIGQTGGFVVSPKEPGDLADKIKALYQDKKLEKQLGTKAHNIFETAYDRNIVTMQYKKLLDEIN